MSNRVRRQDGHHSIDDAIAIVSAMHPLLVGLDPDLVEFTLVGQP
jgi:hypothetical protein